MPRSIDPDTIGFLVGDLSRMMRAEMERRIGEAGLPVTPGEGRTLANIARLGCVRQNVLAERMGVEAMTLSGYLDRLEARGLVTRSTDPADRRAKLVGLTTQADGVLDEVLRIGASVKAELEQALPPGEWTELIDRMKRIRSALAEMRSDVKKREGATT